ncbi:MAG: divalent-cation tolerance protein CutA [candidate division Zixibacteria bacterium]|nr:divalent-cation tolerance protein CutA [candidate division Zixibacteria bacterium]MCI0595455.1 divalent-cation tolerance protein CutA [candidate division Zixibacteria bacterium]
MKAAARHWLVLVTVPDKKTQRKLTSALLAEKLAACVSAFPVLSQYRWKGKIERTNEFQLCIKTSAPIERLKRRIAELHPYEVPEILAFEVKKGLAEYLAWVQKESG